jgi:hypothetical protein
MKQMLPKVGKNGAMLTLDNVSSVMQPRAFQGRQFFLVQIVLIIDLNENFYKII